VREKYCWLAGDWWLVLNWCKRKALLAGSQPNKVLELGLDLGQGSILRWT
jgi:hypothetical protein